ncbi:hypothetical protein BDN72DRAFT_962233 [Pluteus cervinus]|uniref:Uncharacterized protein n=1 Tax=Pluteus cervinus TaxID=181527 RepID=A0ACD3AKN4_9AGAR|nr:hypothetical protein BDN72DRAFT_962233 [Pluteus cervinus]
MAESFFRPLPFELLELICCELSARDLVALSYMNRGTQCVVFPLLLARFKVETYATASRSGSSPAARSLILRFTKQNLCDFLYAMHTAPLWFYKANPTISILCTFPLDIDSEPTIRHLVRLKYILKQVKIVERLAMNFAEHTLRLQYGTALSPSEVAQFDKILESILTLAAKKGCTELGVLNLGLRSRPWSIPWVPMLQRALRWVMVPFPDSWKATGAFRSQLTKAVASGVNTSPFAWARFLAIINSSSTLTSLSIDLDSPQPQKTMLAPVKIPSLRTFTFKKRYIHGPTFESFLRRHPDIEVLDVRGFYFSFPPTHPNVINLRPSLSVPLGHVQKLICSAELLPYFLWSMDDCLPRMEEVTITFFTEFREERINSWLEVIRSQLGNVPSLGLRTCPERSMRLSQGVAATSLVRQHVTRLELYLSAHTDASHLDGWLAFPKVNYVKFWGPESGDLGVETENTRLPVPTKQLLQRVAHYPKILKVVIGDRVYDMKDGDGEMLGE